MNSTEQLQREVCARAGSEIFPCQFQEKIGIAFDTLKLQPIYGVRRLPSDGVAGWYVWGGEFDSSADFFKPVHVAHLEEIAPEIVPYLSLAPGYKFIIDRDGYEDIWFDSTLLNNPIA